MVEQSAFKLVLRINWNQIHNLILLPASLFSQAPEIIEDKQVFGLVRFFS